LECDGKEVPKQHNAIVSAIDSISARDIIVKSKIVSKNSELCDSFYRCLQKTNFLTDSSIRFQLEGFGRISNIRDQRFADVVCLLQNKIRKYISCRDLFETGSASITFKKFGHGKHRSPFSDHLKCSSRESSHKHIEMPSSFCPMKKLTNLGWSLAQFSTPRPIAVRNSTDRSSSVVFVSRLADLRARTEITTMNDAL
jgi:hypothetical protein